MYRIERLSLKPWKILAAQPKYRPPGAAEKRMAWLFPLYPTMHHTTGRDAVVKHMLLKL